MNGKSTVDYMLVSQDLIYSINSFVVNPPSYLSDHCLIYMNLPGYATNSVGEFFEKDLLPIPGSFKWSDQNRDTFIDSLLDPKGMSEIFSLNYLFDDDTFNDITL